MRTHPLQRILALALAAVLVLGLIPGAGAASGELRRRAAVQAARKNRTDRVVQTSAQPEPSVTGGRVRVSIVLEDMPTAAAGFSTQGIGANGQARAYDAGLEQAQKRLAQAISTQALGGERLDVVWNLTLVANLISANVPAGKLDAIRGVPGVREVRLERLYRLDTPEIQTVSSAAMTGAGAAWQSGFTGAGSRIAIVDTGTDTDHQSFDNGAFRHALEQNALERGMDADAYVQSLDLLDAGEIAGVLDKLNIAQRVAVSAERYYLNEKLPFGANYVDKNLVVNHDSDTRGSHGSHVAGIAAANRFVPKDGGYADARQAVLMSGGAPDAQIVTMKVFGDAEGPFDSDYFAAIEDAIWLGCDSVNLSLGTGSPGMSDNREFADLLEFLETTDTVVVMSAGNSGHWAEQTACGNLYRDGVSFHTGGEPGSYTNALTVASVDNDGAVGNYFTAGGRMVVYQENLGFGNAALAALDTTRNGTRYDYILIDGIGEAADYEGLDLTGKVVFCTRGGLSFSRKANIAVALGACAVVICNDQPGVLSMNLTDYQYSAPCVGITRADADAIRASSQRGTTAGGGTYYTGTLTITRGMGAASYGSSYYTMSDFSSWGVPGSLELKPEITAPGGQIWSVNGMDPAGKAYEVMSGTSMAAPQVAAMAALVAQYIRETGLEEKTGLSRRQLAQSLLMSTAVPLREEGNDGGYYSLLNQGAGLARVDLAVSAGSYVLVDGMGDGKVKAELGEDPDRTGEYRFGFTIRNFGTESETYTLRAELFTQKLTEGEDGTVYLDTQTRPLGAQAAFAQNGLSLGNMGDYSRDLNGDGVTNAADGDWLLEYLVGNAAKLYADGDIDGDGVLSAYDAHVLLTRQTGAYTVDVPAGGSAAVEVTLTLTEETRTLLEQQYPTGAYIEGFVFAEPLAKGEGEHGVTHSIPLLGYYGSWTEPGMFDLGSYAAYAGGVEQRTAYLYDMNGTVGNSISIDYGDGMEYYFGGNPILEEDTYLPRRNAFNNRCGASLMNLRYALIRNAWNSRLILKNATTGEICFSWEQGAQVSAYYHTSSGLWQNTQQRLGLGLDLAEFPEGTVLQLELEAAPELYRTADGGTDWDSLRDGARFGTTITIDNTAPDIQNVELEGSTLRVTARDNQYIAAVALLNPSGTDILTAVAGNQMSPDTLLTAQLDLGNLYGSRFLVAVYDYAENVAVREVELELHNVRPRFTAIDRNENSYVGIDDQGNQIHLASRAGRREPSAAGYVDGYVFEIGEDNKLWVVPDGDLFHARFLGELDPDGSQEIHYFTDLAYNPADGKLYAGFYSYRNDQSLPYLATIDLYTGAMTVLGELPGDFSAMAIDGAGNFYSVGYGTSQLYTYRADAVQTRDYKLVGQMGDYGTLNYHSMAWDHETGELFWGCTRADTTDLLKLDPQTGSVTLAARVEGNLVGLYIADKTPGDTFAPTDQVSAVVLPESAETLVDNTVEIRALVQPWNVSDDSLRWYSSDPAVAEVDQTGMVTGRSQGSAVITAVSNLDPARKASCTVTVKSLNRELRGLLWDEAGEVWFAGFHTDTLPAYHKDAAVADSLPLATTAVIDGTLYAGTLDTSTGLSDLYRVDSGYRLTKVGGSRTICYSDLAYAPKLGFLAAAYQNYIALVDPATGEYVGAIDWTEGVAGDLVGITWTGSSYNDVYGCWTDTFLLLDSHGNVYREAIMPYQDKSYATFNGPQDGLLGKIGNAVETACFQGFHFDGSYVYWTRFQETDDRVELLVWDVLGSGAVYNLGCFPDSVWPVGGLYTGDLPAQNPLSVSFADARLRKAAQLCRVERPAVPADREPAELMTVDVTLPAAGPSGEMTITFDTELLELAGVSGGTGVFAWRAEGETLRLAFAAAEPLPAGAQAARLTFRALGTGESSVLVSTDTLGRERPGWVEEIPLAVGHSCPSERFADVNEGDWWHEATDYVVEQGYMNGMDDAHFGPGLTMNRAQFVTVLYRMEQQPAVVNTGAFADVPAGQFYTEAAYWALASGITTGTTPTTFNPGGQLTRTELVTFMYRYAKYKGYDTTAVADLGLFRDGSQVLSFAREPWRWAVTHGIVTGMTADTLEPMRLTNRAQAAVIFQRFDQKM